FFRELARLDIDAPTVRVVREAFYTDEGFERHGDALGQWLEEYAARVREEDMPIEARVARMNAANPRFVLRNYLAQEAIDAAEQGDMGPTEELLEVMRRPYDEQPGREHYAARRPDWARHKAGCSMLSCSS